MLYILSILKIYTGIYYIIDFKMDIKIVKRHATEYCQTNIDVRNLKIHIPIILKITPSTRGFN